MKWKRLKYRQYTWIYALIILWCSFNPALLLLCIILNKKSYMSIIAWIFCLGALLILLILVKEWKNMKISRLMEKFIRTNALYQARHITDSGQRKVEKILYYPDIRYMETDNHILYFRIRLDGSVYSEKLRNMEQAFADMLCSICIEKIEERGYLTYCFEKEISERYRIHSLKDIPTEKDNEILFSRGIIWEWKKCPHILLTGNTGSGKTQTAQYIISALIKQGVRIIYCDPKNDDDMRLFIRNFPSIKYVTKENEIAKVVRETEEEVRSREKDLRNIGIEEAEFNPVFLFFDELIAFSKVAEKKTYEETAKRLSSIVVTGRSKRIYVGIILQRPDTSFIEGAIRDNLGCRIAMGQMSDTAYKMTFGSDFTDIKNHSREIGSGLIFRQGVDTVPREFVAPYIEKGALSGE